RSCAALERRELGAADDVQQVRLRVAEPELLEELPVERDAGTRRQVVVREAVERVALCIQPGGHPEEREWNADPVELDGEASLVRERDQAAVVAYLEWEQHARRGIDDGTVLAFREPRADDPRDRLAVGGALDEANQEVERVEADLVVARQDGG